jgi:hypothetical protein
LAAKGSASRSGGITITNSAVTTGGGDIVGGSKLNVSVEQRAEAFRPIAEAIESADPLSKRLATQQLDSLIQEISKDSGPDDKVMAKLLDGLVGLVPAAVGATVSAFAGPVLGAFAGPATKSILHKLQGTPEGTLIRERHIFSKNSLWLDKILRIVPPGLNWMTVQLPLVGATLLGEANFYSKGKDGEKVIRREDWHRCFCSGMQSVMRNELEN